MGAGQLPVSHQLAVGRPPARHDMNGADLVAPRNATGRADEYVDRHCFTIGLPLSLLSIVTHLIYLVNRAR